jgi:hypothetical protein
MTQDNKYHATAETARENTIICVEDAQQIKRNVCMDAHITNQGEVNLHTSNMKHTHPVSPFDKGGFNPR